MTIKMNGIKCLCTLGSHIFIPLWKSSWRLSALWLRTAQTSSSWRGPPRTSRASASDTCIFPVKAEQRGTDYHPKISIMTFPWHPADANHTSFNHPVNASPWKPFVSETMTIKQSRFVKLNLTHTYDNSHFKSLRIKSHVLITPRLLIQAAGWIPRLPTVRSSIILRHWGGRWTTWCAHARRPTQLHLS